MASTGGKGKEKRCSTESDGGMGTTKKNAERRDKGGLLSTTHGPVGERKKGGKRSGTLVADEELVQPRRRMQR